MSPGICAGAVSGIWRTLSCSAYTPECYGLEDLGFVPRGEAGVSAWRNTAPAASCRSTPMAAGSPKCVLSDTFRLQHAETEWNFLHPLRAWDSAFPTPFPDPSHARLPPPALPQHAPARTAPSWTTALPQSGLLSEGRFAVAQHRKAQRKSPQCWAGAENFDSKAERPVHLTLNRG